MRKLLRVIGIVLIFGMAAGVVVSQARVKQKRRSAKKERKVKPSRAVSGLEMVECSYQGMMMQPVSRVRVERVGGKVVLTSKGTTTDERQFTLADGDELLKKAEEIVLQEKMLDYGVSYSLPAGMEVLDGSSWSFGARFADGRKVDSHGSNAGPEGDGLNRIQSLLFERAMELIQR